MYEISLSRPNKNINLQHGLSLQLIFSYSYSDCSPVLLNTCVRMYSANASEPWEHLEMSWCSPRLPLHMWLRVLWPPPHILSHVVYSDQAVK